MKFAKNMLILSLVGFSLVSFGGGVGPRAASQAARAAKRGAQQTAGLGWKVAQGAAGATGAAVTTAALTGSFSEKPDMPHGGSEQEQTGTADMSMLEETGEAGDWGNGSDVQKPGGTPSMASNFGWDISSASMTGQRDAQMQGIDILVEAIKKGNSAAVQELIQAGVSVNEKDRHGVLPLTVATVLGFHDIVSKLLEAGARVDFMDRRVVESADWGLKNILQFARGMQAELRAVINDQDEFGQTKLMQAVTQNNEEQVRRYLQFGADIDLADINGNTPLLRALILGKVGVADILLAAGADVNKANKSGDTPKLIMFNLFLENAAKAKNTQAVAQLVKEAKADGLDFNREFMGTSPLIVAVQYGTPEMVQIMLDAGVDVNQDIHGLTPIRVAVEYHNVEAAKLLLGAGVNPNETVENGVTLLMLASALGSPDMVRLLLAAGADKDVQVNGYTALDVARQLAHAAVVEMLEKAQQEKAGQSGQNK